MSFLGWFLSRRTYMDWTSWRSLAITFPAMVLLLVVLPKAVRETFAATRQQVSEAIVTSYERANHNTCRYVFSVKGLHYDGVDSAPRLDLNVGDRVVVYFDSQNPKTNALSDFSVMSRSDRNFIFIVILPILACAGAILFSKSLRNRGNKILLTKGVPRNPKL